MVLDGGYCKKGLESTIIGFENDDPIIYRLCVLSIDDIEQVIGKIELKNNNNKTPDAPGMLAKHYAPKTKTILSENIIIDIEKYKSSKIGIISFSSSYMSNSIQKEIILSTTRNLEEASSKLYSAMHDLDALELDIIIVEKMPNKGLGKSMNDRLFRASS